MPRTETRADEFSLRAFLIALLSSAAAGIVMSLLFVPGGAEASTPEVIVFGAIGGVLIGLPFMYVERIFGQFIDSFDDRRVRLVLRVVAYMLAAVVGFGLAFPVAGLVVFGIIVSLPFANGLVPAAIIGIGIAFAIYGYGVLRSRLEASLIRIKEQEFAEKELELARSIQQRLLPPSELEGPGYRIVARNIPATYVAGDFYDVFPLEDGSLGIAVADVAGKGIGASLIMSTAKAMLPLIASTRSVAETMSELNVRLRKDLGTREFVALAYARFDPASGAIELANAGLPNPFLLRSGEATEIDVPGPRVPLGMMKRVDYQSTSFALDVSERFVLFSDGLPEAPLGGDEQLGYERLESILRSTVADGSAAWIDALLAAIVSRTPDGPDDDCTALLLERRR